MKVEEKDTEEVKGEVKVLGEITENQETKEIIDLMEFLKTFFFKLCFIKLLESTSICTTRPDKHDRVLVSC